NVYLALEHDLAVVPVINKIDLPSADVEGTRREIEEVIGLDASKAVPTSAKEGIGIEELLEEIVHTVPPPVGDPEAPLKALIFDSWYDTYRGVIMLVRVEEGTVRPRQKMIFMSNKREYEVAEVGVFAPKARGKTELIAGEVGFVVANVKVIQDAKVGDTLTDPQRPTDAPVPGFKEWAVWSPRRFSSWSSIRRSTSSGKDGVSGKKPPPRDSNAAAGGIETDCPASHL